MTKQKNTKGVAPVVGSDFFEKRWEQSLTYIKTVVDVVREPMLILDKDFCVIAANEPFYTTFKVLQEDTTHHFLHELGNGQWNIPVLQKHLKEILEKSSYFKGFEVAHEFPHIGRKVMIMNGRRIHLLNEPDAPPIILLAMEDITEMIAVTERMASHMNKFEARIIEQTDKLENNVAKLQKQVDTLKK